jgi:hypothetical protein
LLLLLLRCRCGVLPSVQLLLGVLASLSQPLSQTQSELLLVLVLVLVLVLMLVLVLVLVSRCCQMTHEEAVTRQWQPAVTAPRCRNQHPPLSSSEPPNLGLAPLWHLLLLLLEELLRTLAPYPAAAAAAWLQRPC